VSWPFPANPLNPKLKCCLADCTPYLLSLGLTKGQTSLVWVAGPLSGLIVQPIIGVVADESTLRWGRRRPIIAMGSVIVACGLLSLGFTKEIVASFVMDPEKARTATIAVAVLSLYATDFAINGGKISDFGPAIMRTNC
jgi:solute carrier family 45, member 1/2/4